MKSDWELYGEWNDIPILHLDTWNGLYCNAALKKIAGDFLRVLIFWKDNKNEIMYFSKSSQNLLVELISSRFKKDTKYFHKEFNKYAKQRIKLLKRFEQINKMNPSSLSNSGLLKVFLETRRLIGESSSHDWFSFSFDPRILEVVGLDRYLKAHESEKEVILSLTLPETILPTLEEEIEVLKLALKVHGKKKVQILKEYKSELNGLVTRYGWISSLIYYPFKTQDEYAQQVFDMSKNPHLKEDLLEKKEFVNETNRKLKEYITKSNPPKNVINAIAAIRKLSESRARGEMDTLYFFSRCRKLDREISSRLGLPYEDYLNLYIHEVTLLLKGELNAKAVSFDQRKVLEGMYRDEKGNFIRVKEPQKLLSELKSKEHMKSDLKGLPAFPGKITGRVKLIHSSQDIALFREGDILLAKATCVDYVVIMKKASAIITEYGGITSHASVVSRELKVPCIVGIQNITKVLKDGDLVEVDARKGVVTKLK